MKENAKQVVGRKLGELMDAFPDLGTQVKVAQRTGIGQTTIGRIRRGEVNATVDNIKRIAAAFGVPVSYLYDETDVHGLTPEDREAWYKKLTEEALKEHDENVAPGPDIRGKLPLISWVQAGEWSDIVDNFSPGDAEDWIPCPFNHGENAFILRVAGESMYDPGGQKSYAPGDFIAVDPAREAQNRSMVVVKLTDDNKATFKQLIVDPDGTKMLKALNPNWPKQFIEINGNARIVGVVIGKWVPE
ncbi:helix-turn-helix domain-containing protein [Herbaspirillum seropedicae]|uniref:helix-turn-helix domain-containing protein n=1 Tax=Herbaspirillum seropedicae TaxID=964 RepID=UPI003FCD713C